MPRVACQAGSYPDLSRACGCERPCGEEDAIVEGSDVHASVKEGQLRVGDLKLECLTTDIDASPSRAHVGDFLTCSLHADDIAIVVNPR